jgi:hypothetical protein
LGVRDPSVEDLYRAAQKDIVTEVSYISPRPGTDTPVEKISFVTKVGDLGCGVGYWRLESFVRGT